MISASLLKAMQRQKCEMLILQAAEELLPEKSCHILSLEEIAAQVGISNETLNLYFAQKDNLIVQFLRIREIATHPSSAIPDGSLNRLS